jgi:outer membrane lipoprotein carrier protein
MNLMPRPIIKAFLVAMLLGTTLLSPPARAAGITPLEALELLRKGFGNTADFTAEITQEKRIALLKRTMTSRGEVRFRSPDSFYMEIYSPYASRLLLKDNVMTMVFPEEGIRQKSTLPPEEGLLHWFALLDRPITKLPGGVNVRADRRGDTVTLRIMPDNSKGVKELKLTLSADGRIKRLAVEEQNLDRTLLTFHRLRRNVGLTEKDFRIE